MLNLNSLIAFAALSLSASATANAPVRSIAPVFVEGSQYSTVLDQGSQNWRLLTTDGIDLNVSPVDADCSNDLRLPEGIWLLTRDGEGHASLVAPSITELPERFPEEVPLVNCEDHPDAGQLRAPQALIDWIGANGGAIDVRN